MRFSEITLPARDPIAVADGWAALLDVPVAHESAGSTVTVGWSSLRFVPDPAFASSHHLAVTVPDGVFDDAERWMAARTPLLPGEDGAVTFTAAPSWNARNLYFDGPESSVLELIARRDRDDDATGPFGPEHLRGISEVGIAVDRPVPEVAAALAPAGLRPYGDPPGPEFGAIGDIDALLILVAPGRAWFPTGDRLVGAARTDVTAIGGPVGTHVLAPHAKLTGTA